MRISTFLIFCFLLMTSVASADVKSKLDSANDAFKAGENEKAIGIYTKLIDSGELSSAQQKATAFYNRGNVYLKKKDYEQSIQDYSKVLELNDRDINAYYNRGIAYKKIGNLDLAISDYSKVVELNPKDSEAYYNRGIAQNELGRIDLAIDDYTKAIELNPKFARAYFNRGDAYYEIDIAELAKDDHDEAIKLDPALEAFLPKQKTAGVEDEANAGEGQQGGDGKSNSLFTPLNTNFETDSKSDLGEDGYSELTKFLGESEYFDFVSREKTVQGMKEIGMTPGNLYVADDLLKLGKKLEVRYVFAGVLVKKTNILARGKIFSYKLEVYDVESSKLIIEESGRASFLSGKVFDPEYQIVNGAKVISKKIIKEFDQRSGKEKGFFSGLKQKLSGGEEEESD